MLPGVRRQEREQRDREQDAGKRQRPEEAERAPVEFGREGHFGKKDESEHW